MELALSKLSDDLQLRIMDKLNNEYLTTGKYTKDQVSVSPKIMSIMLSGTTLAGTAISATSSPTLFMATARPDTLMNLGNGVGSAVIGASGKIVSQAPFVPIASSLPVVAPIMAMQALSTIVLLHQFSALDKKLDTIQESINKMMARQEVTKVAELFAAVQMVDELYMQYEQARRFSMDMLVRLALVERDAAILSRRYEMLENVEVHNKSTDDFASHDTYCTMLASFLNLRVKYLRTSVDIQENPQFIQHSHESFSILLKEDIALWEKLLSKSDVMKSHIDVLAEKVAKENILDKIFSSKEQELSRKKDKYTTTMERERVILRDFHSLIDIVKQISESRDTNAVPTLLYWQDLSGEHCIATNSLLLDSVA